MKLAGKHFPLLFLALFFHAALAQEPQTGVPETATRPLETETRVLETETRVLETETRVLETETRVQETETSLLRFPDIHGSDIAFVYAGDIYLVDAAGGVARQLTSHEGQELFPKFSPDAKWIAFSAEYNGTRQIYIMPSAGGRPRQLTWYNDVGLMPPRGGFDYQVLGWTPDSKRVLFRGNRLPWGKRMGRYYTISIEGGLESPLPVPEGGSGELSPDGKKLVYTPISREWRTWKRTRGGRAQDVWIFDMEQMTSQRITSHIMTDNMPMWIGSSIYFTSDREHTLNIFRYDIASKKVSKVTGHDDYDVLWPSSGPDAIVYQSRGRLHVLDVRSQESHVVSVEINTDGRQSMPRIKNVSGNINWFSLSPTGKRALFEARGDIFTVPAEHGSIRNLTRSQGVREISPSWSPDGKSIAYLSDLSGEYELCFRPADGSDDAVQLTTGSSTWYFQPQWSPDSKMLVYYDKKAGLSLLDVATREVTVFDRGRKGDITDYTWSPDSRWIAYSNSSPSGLLGVFVYSISSGKHARLSSGLSNDYQPVFSRDGKYLFFFSDRDFNLSISSFEFRYVYNKSTRVYAAALTADTPPLTPWRNDTEEPAGNNAEDVDKESTDSDDEVPEVSIDEGDFDKRVVALPGPSGNYSSLISAGESVLYIRNDNGHGNLYRYDIEIREENTVLTDIGGFELSADGEKILYASKGKYGIVPNRDDQKNTDGHLDLSKMDMRIEAKKEWAQIFNDAWRMMRDWFYDENMHGVDWLKMKAKYQPLVTSVERRSDLDFILGELAGELNAGHTYVNGGDQPEVKRLNGGLLGCEFEDDGNTFYRISHIFRGENWHEAFRSPLAEYGVDVSEGDYLIAIDGVQVRTSTNPWRYLENKANRDVVLLVSNTPAAGGAREIHVRTIASEGNLRFLDWIRSRREYVDSVSQGRIGYIWIPNTAVEGNRELFKWFYAQARKEALIIDDRYNGGGFIPFNMIELLDRDPLNYWARRDIEPFSAPDMFHVGPKVCLINGYSSSGGDAFPYYFKKRALGKLIGTRTWGGLIGLSGGPHFIDGGSINIPTFRFFDTDGRWAIENEGVSPDIEVVDTPHLVAKGQDPSLQKAIEVLLEQLKKYPVVKPVPPTPPDESK